MSAALPDTQQPLQVVERWLEQAAGSGLWRNPNAMALATSGPGGKPSVRMVLLKSLAVAAGYAVFYTHYESRKAGELEAGGWAAGALYWEAYGRQVRLEGRVQRSPPEESDAYFATRPLSSQLNAWASRQSRPLDDAAALERRAEEKARELGVAEALAAGSERAERRVPRPADWGGYRVWCAAVELWVEGRGRFHERVRYERELRVTEAGYDGGPWHGQRLQP